MRWELPVVATWENQGRHCTTFILLTLDFEKKPSLREFLTGSLGHSEMMTPELSPITDELRAEIARQEARSSNIAYLENLDWEEFDDTILDQVVAMLKKAKQQNEDDTVWRYGNPRILRAESA